MKKEIVYGSIFAKELRDLVNYKRSLGCKYDTEERAFLRIDQFLIKQNIQEKCRVSSKFCDNRMRVCEW